MSNKSSTHFSPPFSGFFDILTTRFPIAVWRITMIDSDPTRSRSFNQNVFCTGFCGIILCFGLIEVHAEETCGIPRILSPTQTTIENPIPRFEWTPVANAKRYRLWLESRIPEGRVLFTHDIQTTSTNWTPPTALTETRALLKIKITAICNEDNEKNIAIPADLPFIRFRIDASSKCTFPIEPIVTADSHEVDVHWPTLAGADFYEVSAYSGTEAKLVQRKETRSTRFQFESLLPGMWAISVRPHCPSGYGAYNFKVFNL